VCLFGYVTREDGSLDSGTICDSLIRVDALDFQVMENLLNKLKGTTEEILAKLFETCMSKGSVEVNTLEERVDSMEVWVVERVRLARSQAMCR